MRDDCDECVVLLHYGVVSTLRVTFRAMRYRSCQQASCGGLISVVQEYLYSLPNGLGFLTEPFTRPWRVPECVNVEHDVGWIEGIVVSAGRAVCVDVGARQDQREIVQRERVLAMVYRYAVRTG